MKARARAITLGMSATLAAAALVPAGPRASALQARSAQLAAGPSQSPVSRFSQDSQPPQGGDLTQYVDPFTGTSPAPTADYGMGFDTGDVFPGAVAPHGMLAWSPDTTTKIPGGYWYPDNTTTGFSLTHFSGRGCSYEDDIPFMPVTGTVTKSPGADPAAYDAQFAHADETASPGYYQVKLGSGVDVRLAASTRTGIGQFSYPPEATSSMTINAGGSANGDQAAQVSIDPGTRMVTGSATAHVGCGSESYTVYFAAQFDQPFSAYGTWDGGPLQAGSTSATGAHSGAYLSFDTASGQAVLAKTAVSYVSVAGAETNLAAEDPGWSVGTLRAQTQAAWNALLNKIQVGGGSSTERTVLYTALYHMLIEPGTFNDVNGQYIGFDGKIHTVAPGHTQYDNITTWDGYRSFMPLFAMLLPHQASDVITSMLNDAAQGGPGLPRWEQANSNSAGMYGDTPDPYVANAYAYGARDFDTAAALHAMDLGGSEPTTTSDGSPVRSSLADWLKYHYVPGHAAKTLEYATDDFSIAAFARALGQASLADHYMASAQNWENVFNPATGFAEPKEPDGQFAPAFSPTSKSGFVEGDAYQYTPMVPFDVAGLANAMGGQSAYADYLDRLTSQLNGGPTSPHLFQGNEPSEEIAWQYDYADAPYKTQGLVRRIQTQLYTDSPGGMPGNDDAGALSSWYVWSVLGMYPETPGTGELALGSPMFPETVVHLGNGHTIRIDAPQAAPDAPYVQSLRLDGQGWPRAYLPPSVVSSGATISYVLGTSPNPEWATGPRATPASYGHDQAPAIGYANPAEVMVRPGKSVTLSIAAQNVTHAPQEVTWSAGVPAGVAISSSAGRLVVPPAGHGTQTITVTGGSQDGVYPFTFHLTAGDGTRLADVAAEVVVARPGDLLPYDDNVGNSPDSDPSCGNLSGYGTSYSASALAADGFTPGGTVHADGLTFTWPNVPSCTADNVVAAGQTIRVAAPSGTTALGFLGASTNGALSGPVVIHYADGTSSSPELSLNAWTRGPGGQDITAAAMPYRNGSHGALTHTTYLYATTVPVDPAKTVTSVTLPTVGGGRTAMHIFTIAFGT